MNKDTSTSSLLSYLCKSKNSCWLEQCDMFCDNDKDNDKDNMQTGQIKHILTLAM